MPSMSVMTASPLGFLRASNSSSTRGRPCVMSPPAATPPVWNVRSVNCVPGSPIDWAATMPTADADLDQRAAAQVTAVAALADAKRSSQVRGDRTKTSSTP